MIKLLSIADVISLINAIFGFLAILILASSVVCGEFRLHASFSFILIALLTDGLDGIIARGVKKSKIGDYLESMADTISLGIAPALFVYVIYQDVILKSVYYYICLLFVLIVFLSLCVIRLASFHIMKDKKFFVGLPASASAIIILILAYFKVDFFYVFTVIIIIAFALISGIRFPKPDIRINAIATILIFLTLVFDKSYFGVAPILLLVAIIIYSIGGLVYIKFLTKS